MLAEIVWNQNTLAVARRFRRPHRRNPRHLWAQVQRHKSDNALKRTMVEHGMSPEEI